MAERYPSSPKYEVKNEIELDKVVCRFYAAGDCPDKKCLFPHVNDETKKPDTACRYFLKGTCNYGKSCALDHVGVVERGGLKIIKLSEPQLKEKKRLLEFIELQKRMLSLSLDASALPESYSETHKTEQNQFPQLRFPKNEIGKTQGKALPSLPYKQSISLQKDNVFDNQNLEKRKVYQIGDRRNLNKKHDSNYSHQINENNPNQLTVNLKHNGCSPNDKIPKVGSTANFSTKCVQRPIENTLHEETDDYKNVIQTQVFKNANFSTKYVQTPIENSLPEETGEYKNIIPTQVFKNAIANDQRSSWRKSPISSTHQFGEELPWDSDFNVEKPQTLMTGFSENQQPYMQRSAVQNVTPVVYPQEKVSNHKGKKLVSQQIMENVDKQKEKIENTFGDAEYLHYLSHTLNERFQNLPFDDDFKNEN